MDASAPVNPVLSIDRASYAINENVIFVYGADNATNYAVNIYRDAVRIRREEFFSAGVYYFMLTQPGNYTAYLTAWNSAGEINSPGVSFTVISQHEIRITAGQGGSASGGGIFEHNALAELRAVPAAGFVFSGWFENGASVNNNAAWSFQVTAGRTLEARFAPAASNPSQGASDWARAEIDRAAAIGLIPPELLENYQANITRAEFCRAVVRMLMVKSGTLENQNEFTRRFNINLSNEPFADTSDRYIKMAYALRIVNGVGNNLFAPGNFITRQESAAMLSRAAEVFEFTEWSRPPAVFEDTRNIAVWALRPVDFVSANGIMQGVGSGRFDPHGFYTREQAILTMLRLYEAFP
jgi:hypothetical protein